MKHPLYALTFHRPWCWAVVACGKDFENRTWRPLTSVISHYIAIHSGAIWDSVGADEMRMRGLPVPEKAEWPAGRIVGLARVTGFVEDRSSPATSPWYSGPVGWKLHDLLAIEPVPCRGAQGLWRVEGATLDLVRIGFAAAREARA